MRWTIADLAKRSGVAVRTIKRFEQSEGVPPSRSATLMSLKSVFEKAGVDFIGDPTDRPGIRVASKPDC